MEGTAEILVGAKSVMNYVNAIKVAFERNETVVVRARGMSINRAVDALEIYKEFHPVNESIRSFTVRLDNPDKTYSSVSEIEITMRQAGTKR